MKHLLTVALAAALLLAGCAGKKAMEEPPVAEVPPPAVEQPAPPAIEEPPVPEPVAIEPAPVEEVAPQQAAERIFFDFDSYRLSSANKEALEGNALWLEALPEVRIVIQGHADERGSDTYNLALGDKRAQAARDYLVARGIAPERMIVISYGEEKATQGATEAEWAKDRKAEFVIAD